MQRLSITLPVVALLFLSSSAKAEIVVPQDVLGGGGGAGGCANYSAIGTFGQAVTGTMSDPDYMIEMGFWYPRNQITCSDWANHNIGNCILTVTDRGILGFMDGSQEEGSGFVYPLSDPDNRLYIGSLWVGESESYIANRDYDPDPAQEWIESSVPDGHTWIDYGGNSHQDIHAAYTDSAAAQPRGLFVDQESWAFAYNSVAIDFVIILYRIKNQSGNPMNDLYIGTFLDVDINSYTQNTGSTEAGRKLAYITDPSNIHVGLRLLEEQGGGPPLSNLTLIHNPTYVWPNSYILDVDKFGFLSASGPQYILTNAPDPDDYSILASAGPIDLAVGQEKVFAFAILGGQSLDDLRVHADVAQQIYTGGFADASEEAYMVPAVTRLMPSRPNPFGQETLIRFSLAQAGDVHLGVYDVNGRLVRCLAKGWHPAMNFALSWDGRDEGGNGVATGVYFLRLAASDKRECRRLIRLR